MEIAKFWPDIQVYQQACPMWVPLVENNEHLGDGADFFIKKYLGELMMQDKGIDTLLLACTHYPLLIPKIKELVSHKINIISQGPIVAASLADYLKRHPLMEARLSKHGEREFYTTDDHLDFERHAGIFFGKDVQAQTIHLS
jgi:glutamate racemase